MNAHTRSRPDLTQTWGEGWRIYRRLLGYAFVHWRVLVFAAVAMVIMAMTEAAFAALMKPLLDDAFAAESTIPAHWIPLALLALFFVRGLAEFGSQFAMRYVGRHVVKAMRAALFARLVDLPVATLERGMTGQWVARVTYNAEQVATAATDGFTILVRDVITIIVLIIWMLILSPLLTTTVLLVLPVVVALAGVVTRHFRRNAHRLQFNMGDVTHVTQEVLDNHRVVRLHGAEAFEQRRFDRVNERNRQIHLRIDRVSAAYIPTVQFLVAVVLALVIWIATSGVFGEPVTAGTFVSFLTAMLLLLSPVRRLTTLSAKLQSGIAAGQSIFEVIDAPGEQQTGHERIARARGALTLDDVWFAYPRETALSAGLAARPQPEDEQSIKWVLRGVSLSIVPGERVALVGPSGSGKTTLMQLLPGFHRPTRGVIRLDGHDADTLHLGDRRCQFAWVGQNVTLFAGTVLENIAYGDAEPDRARAEAVARDAQAWDFISAMPQGLDTPIGEDGSRLSGGQRQRLAIARALYRDAPILLLDEPTSALDPESEGRIQQALERAMQGRTTVVIAHRLHTVRHADRIVVLDGGRVVQQGRHDDLVAAGGRYVELLAAGTWHERSSEEPASAEPDALAAASGESRKGPRKEPER